MNSSHPPARPDWGYRLLLAIAAVMAAWLLAMPWTPAIQRCLLNRFHLRTNSFVGWAIQQPIPPMYSCRNTTEIRTVPPQAELAGLIDPLLLSPLGSDDSKGSFGVIAGRTINHFPTREITFANSRLRYLRDDHPKWFVLSSTYLRESLESVYELQPSGEGGWTMKLQEE